MNNINLKLLPLRKKNIARPKHVIKNTIKFLLLKTKFNLINNSSKIGAINNPRIIFFKYGNGICFASNPKALINSFIEIPKGISNK